MSSGIKRNKKGQFTKGTTNAWNKGLTKKDDERIKKQGITNKNLIQYGLRKCWKCQQVLVLNTENFSRSKNEIGGFSYLCKECAKKYRRKDYYKNRERNKEYSKRYRKNHRKELTWKREVYMHTVRGKYMAYKADARRRCRQIEWMLSLGEFENIVRQPCIYCGGKDENGLVGVDRKDYKKSYTVRNCAPCCKICNRVKWILTPMEFIDRCKKIVKYTKGKKI